MTEDRGGKRFGGERHLLHGKVGPKPGDSASDALPGRFFADIQCRSDLRERLLPVKAKKNCGPVARAKGCDGGFKMRGAYA